MKKLISIIIAVLFFTTILPAQKIKYGIKAGVTNNFLTFNNDDGSRSITHKAGFYAGAVANFQLSKHFALQPNLLFAMKGGKPLVYKINMFYIDVPVNLLYTHNGFFIGAGPNFSYGVSGTIKWQNGQKFDIFNQDEAMNYTLKRFEIGANCLMGYTFSNGIVLSGSFTPGLSNIYKGEAGDPQFDFVTHNKSFGLALGYMFGAKGRK
jgi:hypothetical protein